jgi:hypothetical protein
MTLNYRCEDLKITWCSIIVILIAWPIRVKRLKEITLN